MSSSDFEVAHQILMNLKGQITTLWLRTLEVQGGSHGCLLTLVEHYEEPSFSQKYEEENLKIKGEVLGYLERIFQNHLTVES